MIALWGILDEPPLAAVRAALVAAKEPFFVIDQRGVHELSIELGIGASASGRLLASGRDHDLSDVKALYLRPYAPASVAAVRVDSTGRAARHALAMHEALRVWAELSDAFVVNRPSASASNASKPYQTAIAAEAGFTVPETVLTTDPKVAAQYADDHADDVIYKSMSDVRSIVSRLEHGQRPRLEEIRGCPLQLQARVPGLDVRVHVVGTQVFACEITTKAIDYRYPGSQSVKLRPIDLPGEIAERCLTLAQTLGLPLAGIDLRNTPDDDWVCFEVNPAPAFTVFDFDGAIAQAIAQMLIAGGV